MDYGKARNGDEVVTGPHAWLIFKNFPRVMGFADNKEFSAAEYPLVVCNFQSVPQVWISDPEIAQDIFVSKNVHVDKTPDSFLMFEKIIGQSFIFSRNDDTWRAKRKACSHAFYKDRLEHMLETLKVKLIETFIGWNKLIKESENGSHEINMATEFSDILARNIIHICFGEDLSDELITLQVLKDGQWSSQTMTVKESIYIIVGQVLHSFYRNVSHPINWLYPHTEKLFEFDSDSRKVAQNCKLARQWIKAYIL